MHLRSKLFRDTQWLSLIFLILTLATGLRLALLTPIGQVADEPAHIARAGALLHGEWLGHRVAFQPPGKPVMIVPATRVNFGLLNASIHEMGATCADPASAAKTALQPWTKAQIIDIDYNTIQYFPALYLPGTLGIALGRALGQRPLAALFTGRMAMLAAYILVGTLAIVIARFGRGLLFATLSLPEALSLGASFNQDGLLIAMTALAGGLLTLDPARHPRLRWLFLPVFTLIICSKPPYGLLLFAALAPLAAPKPWRRGLTIALWAILPLIWVVVMARVSLMPYLLGPYHPGPLWPGLPSTIFTTTDPLAQVRVLLADPLRLITLPVGFLIANFEFLVTSGIGRLGWLSIGLAPWDYAGWGIALGAAALGVLAARGDVGLRWTGRDAAMFGALVVASVLAVELAIYLSWDRVGSAAISGPQGRYYLLFLPFLMLAVPRLGGRSGPALEGLSAMPAVVMAAIDMVYLPGLMLHRFCLG
ncbi:MAG: DUF2142 domain-containing protein [Acidiphilium sp.]|nr:DUF2142 domain-containing protein [Acidiphilium sp.]MDD4934829.1 DUF2142 domain-containing protein [Acidiphilium sp.]